MLGSQWDLLDFPRTILADPAAAVHVDGTAFHLYAGTAEAQSVLQAEFPNKHIYFTEGSTFGAKGATEIIQILRHGARSYNFWVFMLDEHQQPNRGPHHADPTPIERLDDGTVRYNFDYYMYGQFMKFIPRGAVRIHSAPAPEDPNGLAHVAFREPNGNVLLVVANPSASRCLLTVTQGEGSFRDRLDAKTVATYRWSAP